MSLPTDRSIEAIWAFCLASNMIKRKDLGDLRIAIIYFWLTEKRGGERVLEAICELFPHADIFTNVLDTKIFANLISSHSVKTSFIQRLPFSKKLLVAYVPFMPFALEQFDFSAYDLVISFESGPAKGVIVKEDCTHVCYCFSPMRYIWNKHTEYLRWSPKFLSWPMRLAAHYLRIFDYVSAARVDHFIADSTAVARRIEKYYRRSSQIVFPPVDIAAFEVAEDQGYYLYCGQLTHYKRPDLAVDAFNELGLPLRIIGDGEMRRGLQKHAKSNIEFLGRASDEVVRYNLARCRALVFPGEEDFGIVPLEAMASGRPVIAYAKGGALDTVVDGVTGLFFDAPNPKDLALAVQRFEGTRQLFESAPIRQHARKFDKTHFKESMHCLLLQLVESQGHSCPVDSWKASMAAR